jgi:hypothetical protein
MELIPQNYNHPLVGFIDEKCQQNLRVAAESAEV